MKQTERRSFLKHLFGLAGVAIVGYPPLSFRPFSRTSIPRQPTVTAIVLGSGQDGGTPQAACRSQHCVDARNDPSLRRRSPCLALLDHNERKSFVFDAGPDFASQIDDLPGDWIKGRNPIDGVLLTHAHIGHYAGLVQLGREVLGTSGLPVYCSAQMAEYLTHNGPWSLLVKLGNIDLRPISPGQVVRLTDNITVKSLSVPHRAEFTDTVAYIIDGPHKRLLYLPDIDRWDGLEPPIEKIVREVDIALLDGTFYSPEELPGRDLSKIPHPMVTVTMERLGEQARQADKKILFSHLNHSNLLLDADGVKLKNLRERGFDITHDGMIFNM